MGADSANDVARRLLAWRRGAQAAICDRTEPWDHGTVVRASRYPDYFDYNLVRVERDPGMDFAELAAVADEALAGLGHRRIDFDSAELGESLRAAAEAAGWRTVRLVWMRHAGRPPQGPAIAVKEVPYEAVHPLRVLWHQEDFPGRDPGDHLEHAREVAMGRGARVLAGQDGSMPVAYAQLEQVGRAAEISQVYVHPDHRDGGRGTAMTRAAIEAARGLDDLWICADDEDRPKRLYRRLGFEPVATTIELQRWP